MGGHDSTSLGHEYIVPYHVDIYTLGTGWIHVFVYLFILDLGRFLHNSFVSIDCESTLFRIPSCINVCLHSGHIIKKAAQVLM